MKKAMANSDLRVQGKEVSSYVAHLVKEIKTFNENDRKRHETRVDERAYLKQAAGFFGKEFSSQIQIHAADGPDMYDPANKKRYAVPLRPAIYVE
jgi:leucyl-tRNA synthetase